MKLKVERFRKQYPERGRYLIFCRTPDDTKEVAMHLGIDFFYAELPKPEQSEVIKKYLSSKISGLATTTCLGAGINWPFIWMVIHYQMPYDIEGFYQEIGRCSRGQKHRALSVIYFDPKDDWSSGRTAQVISQQQLGVLPACISTMFDLALEKKECLGYIMTQRMNGVGKSCAGLPEGSQMCCNCQSSLTQYEKQSSASHLAIAGQKHDRVASTSSQTASSSPKRPRTAVDSNEDEEMPYNEVSFIEKPANPKPPVNTPAERTRPDPKPSTMSIEQSAALAANYIPRLHDIVDAKERLKEIVAYLRTWCYFCGNAHSPLHCQSFKPHFHAYLQWKKQILHPHCVDLGRNKPLYSNVICWSCYLPKEYILHSQRNCGRAIDALGPVIYLYCQPGTLFETPQPLPTINTLFELRPANVHGYLYDFANIAVDLVSELSRARHGL
jgi:hypothetical protein